MLSPVMILRLSVMIKRNVHPWMKMKMKKEKGALIKELGKMADNLHDHLLPYKFMRLTFRHLPFQSFCAFKK